MNQAAEKVARIRGTEKMLQENHRSCGKPSVSFTDIPPLNLYFAIFQSFRSKLFYTYLIIFEIILNYSDIL